MKNLLLILSASLVVMTAAGQAIPNGNFENWTLNIYNVPSNYVESSNTQSFYEGLGFNVVREDTGTFDGLAYDIQLTTVGSGSNTQFGYILNTNPNNGGSPLTWQGGFPYAQTPTGIRGWYKSDVQPGDTAIVFSVLRSGGSPVGIVEVKLTGTHTAWTLFTGTFTPLGIGTPDSVILGAVSSDALSNTPGIAGSTITLDSISFTGVSSQPTLLNGNFASWQTDTISILNGWYASTGNNNQEVVTQTTDAHNGQYAVELQTYLGNNNSGPAAQAATVGTGYYPNNCGGFCTQVGGYPDTVQVDTLVFWYKYVPSGSDTAQVNISFKKNGSSIGGADSLLPASANYTEVDVPFNVNQPLDTIIVEFQSSIYSDSTTNFVGSDLKVDLVYFKSQPIPTGIPVFVSAGGIKLYPNPSKDFMTIDVSSDIKLQDMQVRMYDLLGKTVQTFSINQYKTSIYKNDLPAGMYFYQLINNNQVLQTGKMVFE